jgi:transitional endoplasmic reticulum ATPase
VRLTNESFVLCIVAQGVLLYGPPGCAKTSLVRAAAWAAQATLITLSGADVYSPFVGEAEKTLRNAFKRAREALPAVLFFDELDALVGKRDLEGGSGGTGGDAIQSRVLSTFLNEMDGVDTHGGGLLVMAATNRPDCLDAALLRAGRFDVRIFVGPPASVEAREQILRVHTVGRKMPLNEDVNLTQLAEKSEGFTGAELAAVCSEAAMLALRQDVNAGQVCMQHFVEVLAHFSPSVSPELVRRYQLFEDGGY